MVSVGDYLFAKWDVIALCVAMAIVFGLEMAGVFGKNYLTITQVVRTTMPRWCRAMVLGWMAWHFMSK